MSNFEIEATLAICSATPALLADKIADLTAIGSYLLRPQPELAIRDFYVDLTDHALRKHGFGLRVRMVGRSQKLTIKGRPEVVVGGGRSREEMELTWSEDALNAIVSRVADDGLVLVPPSDVVDWHDPLAVLSGMGFVTEQTRFTSRRPRDVYAVENPTALLAELVVDSVSYQFSFGEVRHHEVEIEAKASEGAVAMQEVSDGLLSTWPEELRKWDYGKRSTGKVVAELIEAHGKNGLIAATGDILPEAYDLIESQLR